MHCASAGVESGLQWSPATTEQQQMQLHDLRAYCSEWIRVLAAIITMFLQSKLWITRERNTVDVIIALHICIQAPPRLRVALPRLR